LALIVIPAKAGTQYELRVAVLDPRFRGGDGSSVRTFIAAAALSLRAQRSNLVAGIAAAPFGASQ
jgi:hypothetical protein